MKTVHHSGYTILEVLIVIAVSASMFVIAVIVFGGRQQQIQFTQGVRDFDSKLRDIFNDVSTGYYPDFDTPCRVQAGSPRPGTGPLYNIGENPECVLIGKTIQFSPLVNNGVNDDGEFYNVYNVVGLRENSSNSNPTTLIESVPRIVRLSTLSDYEESKLRYGLKVTRVSIGNASLNLSGGIAIYSSLNRGVEIASSATNETLQIGTVPGTSLGITGSAYESAFDTQILSTFIAQSRNEITICVSDPDNRRKAAIRFGGIDSQIASKIDFENVGSCP